MIRALRCMCRCPLSLALLLVTSWSAAALAAPDRTISYQGTLERDGAAVPNATLPMTFHFYSSATTATPLQSVPVADVAISAGRFAVEIGPISDTVFDSPTLYLGVEVDGVALEGRTRIRGVPYAIRGAVVGDFRAERLAVDDEAAIGGDLHVAGDVSVTGDVYFPNRTRQMLNLWGTGFGIGVQDSTLYQRSDKWFTWYRGGSHHNQQGNAGGGTKLMELSDQGVLWTAKGTALVAPETVGLVRGTVGYTGSVLHGSGYTVQQVQTGVYDITFSPAFVGRPTVVCAGMHPNEGNNTSGVVQCLVDHPNNISNSKVRILVTNGLNEPTSWAFSFIAVGPR